MREITVPLRDRSYPILIGGGLLESLGEHVRAAGYPGSRGAGDAGGRLALVQDEGVAATLGARARRSLERAGFRVVEVVVPAGEASKSLERLGALYDAFAAGGLDRGSAVVAL